MFPNGYILFYISLEGNPFLFSQILLLNIHVCALTNIVRAAFDLVEPLDTVKIYSHMYELSKRDNSLSGISQ